MRTELNDKIQCEKLHQKYKYGRLQFRTFVKIAVKKDIEISFII